MASTDADVIERILRVLEQARRGNANVEDLIGASIALQMFRERLLLLFAFPTFPEQGEGILRLGAWESLPRKQREAYDELKAMLGLQ